MRIPFVVVVAVIIAAPVVAQRAQPSLPAPLRGVDYVESVCTGGIDGRREQIRVLATGQVLKITRRSDGVLNARATRGELTKIWRALDRAKFEQRSVPAEKPSMMDGVNCTLTRSKNGRVHRIALMQQIRDRPQYRDLSAILADLNALGQRATGPILRPAGSR